MSVLPGVLTWLARFAVTSKKTTSRDPETAVTAMAAAAVLSAPGSQTGLSWEHDEPVTLTVGDTVVAKKVLESVYPRKAAKAEESDMGFISDLKSVAGKIEADITKLWGKAPSFDTVALTTLEFAGPVLETVVTLEGGAAVGGIVTTVINKAETDLIAAKNLIAAVGPTVSVKGLIAGVASDLSDADVLAAIKSPTSVANVKLVVSELTTLANSFPTAAATPGVSVGQTA